MSYAQITGELDLVSTAVNGSWDWVFFDRTNETFRTTSLEVRAPRSRDEK